ncbi:hypothetical protein LINPERPRIM_LOCUS22456 [Linum perenne]
MWPSPCLKALEGLLKGGILDR